jgi:hypothetical protein
MGFELEVINRNEVWVVLSGLVEAETTEERVPIVRRFLSYRAPRKLRLKFRAPTALISSGDITRIYMAAAMSLSPP